MELIVAIVSGVIAVASALFSVFTYHSTVVHDRKQATLWFNQWMQMMIVTKPFASAIM